MSERFESQFHAPDQTELFFQHWPAPRGRGTLIITHGLAEHSDCYERLARQLAAENWEVFAWDLRGHGRSEGKRGYVRHFDDYVSDLQTFIELVAKERKVKKSLPLVVFGHSMGGLITAKAIIRSPKCAATACVLSSPLFGIAVKVPKIKDQIARIAYDWLPTLTLHNEMDYADLSRDEEMQRIYPTDALRHDKISPGVYLGIIESCQFVFDHAPELQLPTLLLLAGQDRIVSTPASQEVFQRLGSRRKISHLYPDSYHEIFNDLDRDVAFADLKKYLNEFQGEKE